MRGLLLILSGPSGVGKDTVLAEWVKKNPLVERIVTYTTRPPRTGEVDGVDYNFVPFEEFEDLDKRGAFIESENVYGNWYATPKSDVEKCLFEGKIAVLKIDVKGARRVMTLRPDALTIFLKPPTMRELEERIRERAKDTEEAIARRLDLAREEMRAASEYDYQVVNDSISLAVDEIEKVTMARYRQVAHSEPDREG